MDLVTWGSPGLSKSDLGEAVGLNAQLELVPGTVAGDSCSLRDSLALNSLSPYPRCCLCPARPRFAPGVTIEEDNCCGCNAIAIRRHFLDENMTAVDIVYTSCHDAVRPGRAGAWCLEQAAEGPGC